jgi:hypothetical protein
LPADGLTPLFVVANDGSLRIATSSARLEADPGDKIICLAEGPGSSSPRSDDARFGYRSEDL